MLSGVAEHPTHRGCTYERHRPEETADPLECVIPHGLVLDGLREDVLRGPGVLLLLTDGEITQRQRRRRRALPAIRGRRVTRRPAPRWELMLLRTWPSRRARLGHALQLLASLGAGEEDLKADLGNHFGRLLGGKKFRDGGSAGVFVSAEKFAKELNQHLLKGNLRKKSAEQLKEFCRLITHESRVHEFPLGDLSAENLDEAIGAIDPDVVLGTGPHWRDYGLVASHSRALHTTRTALAFWREDLAGAERDPRVELIAAACRKWLGVGRQDFPRSSRRMWRHTDGGIGSGLQTPPVPGDFAGWVSQRRPPAAPLGAGGRMLRGR